MAPEWRLSSGHQNKPGEIWEDQQNCVATMLQCIEAVTHPVEYLGNFNHISHGQIVIDQHAQIPTKIF